MPKDLILPSLFETEDIYISNKKSSNIANFRTYFGSSSALSPLALKPCLQPSPAVTIHNSRFS